MKNDYQQQKKDPKEINLSYSQIPNPQRNQSIELAAKNGLNQSRSINPNNSITQYQNTGVASQPHFRIGPLSSNVSREISVGKKGNTSNLANISNDERSKNGPSQNQGTHLGQRRSSKVVLARNMSPKSESNPENGSHYPKILSTGTGDYNLLGNSGREALPRTQTFELKKGAQVDFRLPEQGDQRGDDQNKNSRTINQTQGDAATRGDMSPKASTPSAVVHWADALNGQDIRTELKFGDCLGQGSFAKVYEGFDKRLKIPVAIKVIDKRKIKDTETKKKALIEEEIYIFSRLDHPNIVKFIRLIEDVKRVLIFDEDLYSNGTVRIKHIEQLYKRPPSKETPRRSVLQNFSADCERCRVHAQYGFRSSRSKDD